MKKISKRTTVLLLALVMLFAGACQAAPPAKEYTVTFDAMGGSAVQSQQVQANKKATEAVTTRDGYIFAGWHTDPACTTPYNFDKAVTSSFTLYAKWELETYTVSFHTGGGSPIADQQVQANGLVERPEDPVRANYAFSGWYYDHDEDGLVEERLWDFEGFPVTGALTLNAHWTQTHYAVSFVTNTGDNIDPQSVEFGGVAVEPAALTKAGHTFVGWYTSVAFTTKWNFDNILEQDRVLFARWYENKTVDGDLSDWSEAELEHFVVCRAQNNAAESRGWTLNAKYVKDAGLWLAGFIDHNTVRGTSTGDWFKQTNIEYKINGQSAAHYVNTDGQTNIPALVEKVIITKAKATEGNGHFPNTYRSYFEVFYPEDTVPNLVPGGPQRIGFAVATNNDRIAVGNREPQVWWCNEGKDPNNSTGGYYVFDDVVGINGPISSRGIFVNANRSPVTGSITFNTNGGTPVTPETVQIGKKIVRPADPERTDYSFAGWFKDAGLSIAWDFDRDAVMQSYPLYAKWTPAVQYSVAFDANGADSGTPDPLAGVWVGSTITAPDPAPVKSGFVFMGWYKDVVLENEWIFSADTVTGNITLYAKWQEIEVFTVTFDTNGGKPVGPQSIETGGLVVEPDATEKAGYTFVAWCKDAALTVQWNFTTDKIAENTTLYALWYKNPDGDISEWFDEGTPLYQGVRLRDADDGVRGVDVYAYYAPEGVYIAMVMHHNETAVTNAGAWYTCTNAEFWMNGNHQYWASMRGTGEKSDNVTAMAFSTGAGTEATYKTVFEIFVAREAAGGFVKMAFAAKPNGGGEKLKLAGFTNTGGLDAWWMVSQNTVNAQTDSGISYGGLNGSSDNMQFWVYGDGISITAKA